MTCRQRINGTKEYTRSNAKERIIALKEIVQDKAYAKIDGIMVDLTSASIIMSIYDKLSKTNQEKYAKQHVGVMLDIAFKIMRKQ